MVTRAERMSHVIAFADQAREKHGKIFPLRYFKTFSAGITEEFQGEKRYLLFWYNTSDHSTHILTKEVK